MSASVERTADKSKYDKLYDKTLYSLIYLVQYRLTKHCKGGISN